MLRNQQAAVTSADIAYIRRHWGVLAAEAWFGYLKRGRGVLVIDLGSGMTPSASYCTDLGERFQGWPSPELAAQVQMYDPSREIIVLVMRDTGTVLTYRLEAARLPPPQAYAYAYLRTNRPVITA